MALFSAVSLPYYSRHIGRSLLLVLAVSLGVSSMVATGTLVESAIAGLESAWGVDSSLADLRIANGFAGVPEDLIEEVRATEGVSSAAGILTAGGSVARGEERVRLLLLGVDLLGDDAVHGQGGGLARKDLELADETDFLVRANAIAIPRDFASAQGLTLGSQLDVNIQSRPRSLYVAGLFEPNATTALLGGAVLVMDLPATQLLLGRTGVVQAIDVRATEGGDIDALHEGLERLTAGKATVTQAGARSPELRSLIFNIRLVLDVAGAVAIVIGALVIYHAIGMAMSRRKPELDLVQTLGAARTSLTALLSLEALLLGGLGAAVGTLAGTLLAWAAGSFFQDAIGTLYMAAPSAPLDWSPRYVAVASILAIGITWLATIGPSRDAIRITSGLRVTSPSKERWRRARQYSLLGALLFLGGVLIPLAQHPGMSTATLAATVISGDILVLAGLGLALPVLVLAVAPIAGRVIQFSHQPTLQLGWQNLSSDPARSAAVLTSIMFATANVLNTVGVVDSLRDGIMGWVGTSQQADLLVTAAGSVGLLPSSPTIPSELESILAQHSTVAAAEPFRLVAQPYRDRWVVISTRDPKLRDSSQSSVVAGDAIEADNLLRTGTGVVASEHFAIKHELSVGDHVELRTPSGPANFRLAAIVIDYTGDLGTLFVAPSVYQRFWLDDGVTAIRVALNTGVTPTSARNLLDPLLAPLCDCSMLTREEFHEEAENIVAATFYTAYGLEAVASFVMVVAIFSFFTIALEERRKEMELLRSIGATRGQVIRSVLFEAGLLGLMGGVVGSVVAFWLAQRIVDGAIRIGGGMALEFVAPSSTALLATGVAVMVSVLASAGPAWLATRESQSRPDARGLHRE